jgi:hypothetical protein
MGSSRLLHYLDVNIGDKNNGNSNSSSDYTS